MKAFSLWVSVAAIGVTVGLAGNAWCQTTTQTDSTVSTTPAEPSVSSKTVTTKTEVNPPVVVMRPSSSSSETTTTQSDTPYEPAPSVQENSRSKTTYGPDGGFAYEEHETVVPAVETPATTSSTTTTTSTVPNTGATVERHTTTYSNTSP